MELQNKLSLLIEEKTLEHNKYLETISERDNLSNTISKQTAEINELKEIINTLNKPTPEITTTAEYEMLLAQHNDLKNSLESIENNLKLSEVEKEQVLQKLSNVTSDIERVH